MEQTQGCPLDQGKDSPVDGGARLYRAVNLV